MLKSVGLQFSIIAHSGGVVEIFTFWATQRTRDLCRELNCFLSCDRFPHTINHPAAMISQISIKTVDLQAGSGIAYAVSDRFFQCSVPRCSYWEGCDFFTYYLPY